MLLQPGMCAWHQLAELLLSGNGMRTAAMLVLPDHALSRFHAASRLRIGCWHTVTALVCECGTLVQMRQEPGRSPTHECRGLRKIGPWESAETGRIRGGSAGRGEEGGDPPVRRPWAPKKAQDSTRAGCGMSASCAPAPPHRSPGRPWFRRLPVSDQSRAAAT